ncbi:hypothetical protein N8Y93_03895 [Litorivicinus sp.]|nr:hypothetical protein [Litorivicinus sp.]
MYDPEQRYRDSWLEMATDKRLVVDSSDSSITSRAEAVAKNSYEKFGFSGYELNSRMGKALFWEKAMQS